MHAVKVARDAYMKFMSRTPAERAAPGGSGASVGLELPDQVPLFGEDHESRFARRAAKLCVGGSRAQELRHFARPFGARDAGNITL